MRVILFDWGPSPFCLKVRAILDHKGVKYDKVSILGPRFFELRRRGRVGKVPAIELDGRLVVDSTEIAYELERLFPSPAILPSNGRKRSLSHTLEDWADESLYFIGLYFQWLDPEGAPMVSQAFGRSLFGRIAYLFYRRRIRAQVIGQGTGRKTPEHVLADLERELVAIEGLLDAGPYLLGDEPTLADFAVMAQLVYLSRPPRSARALEGHPRIGEYLERMKALRAPSPPLG